RRLRRKRIDRLLHAQHVQRGDPQYLGFATLEQRGTVCARYHTDLGSQGTNVGGAPTVDTDLVPQDPLPDQVLGQRLERGTDFLVPTLEGLALTKADPLQQVRLHFVGGVVAVLLAGAGQRRGELIRGGRRHRLVDVVLVGEVQRVLAGGFARRISQPLLCPAQLADEWFGSIQALGDGPLVRPGRSV